jgi:O-antigen/teichoic acid export membrane protein
VFIEKKQKGLENLWTSRAYVHQRFWGVLARQGLVVATLMVVNILLNIEKSALLTIISFIISLFINAFMVSFNYEMYRALPEPKEVKKPTLWIAFSIVGWILMFLLTILFFKTIIEQGPKWIEEMQKNVPENQQMYKNNQKFITPQDNSPDNSYQL